MSTTALTVMTEIQEMLQEESEFASGFWSETEVIGYIDAIQKNFVLHTEIIKQRGAIQAVATQRIYSDPTNSMQIDRIAFGEIALWRATRFTLDSEDRGWRTKSERKPRKYHQDQLSNKKFELDRAPTSGMVGMGYTPSGTAGVLRRISGSFSYTAVLPVGGGGTLRTVFGTRAYNFVLNPRGRGGTLRQALSGATNIELIFTELPVDLASRDDELTVPDFCVPYIKLGTMMEMLLKEGEGQDLARATYCRRRYLFGINLFRRLMGLEPITENQLGIARGATSA